MTTAFLVGTPFSNPNSWANISGGVGGSFGGLPDENTDVIIDANSVNAVADISSKINSITKSNAAVAITQSTDIDVNQFNISNGSWTTGVFAFNCTNIFTQSGGTFDASLATQFLIGVLNISAGTFLGSPSLPTVDTSSDVAPTTIAEALVDAAINPKRVKDDMGEVEMPDLRAIIAADKHTANKSALSSGIAPFLKQMKPTSSL